MQTSLSSQTGVGPPPTHVPALHASTVVQASPSSHGAVLSVYSQPAVGLQT